MTTAYDNATEARDQVLAAVGLVAAGIQDPGPAAGARCAIAIGPLTRAVDVLVECGERLDADSRGQLAITARSLSRDSAARSRELGFAAAVPWPFVYAPLGAIFNALLVLKSQVIDFHAQVPQQVPLEPVNRATEAAVSSTSWSPEAFPWPGVKSPQ